MSAFKFCLAALSILSLSEINAEPVVIFDTGRTMPTYQYKVDFMGVDIPDFGKDWSFGKAQQLDKDTEKDPRDPLNWLPISTTKLTPGTVKPREVKYNGLQSSICIIGSDERSLDWIKKYHDILYKNEVLCWLVSAESIEEIQGVVEALDGIAMSPAKGDDLADFFSLDHYPVLITPRFIEQ